MDPLGKPFDPGLGIRLDMDMKYLAKKQSKL